MSMLTIRNLDPAIKDGLGVRGGERPLNGRQIAHILTVAVVAPGPAADLNLYDHIRARIDPLGIVDLEHPSRTTMSEPPT